MSTLTHSYERGHLENCVHVGNWVLVLISQQKDRTIADCSFPDYPYHVTMLHFKKVLCLLSEKPDSNFVVWVVKVVQTLILCILGLFEQPSVKSDLTLFVAEICC